MRKHLLTLLLACSVLFTYAQKPATSQKSSLILKNATPESVGMSSEHLQRIDKMLLEYTSNNYVPGAIALIARDGKMVYQKTVGVNDLEAKTPLAPDAIMRIASQTKALTSLGVMLLFEEGKFLLDEPISKYLPSYKNLKVLETFNEKDSSYTTVPA